MSTSLQVLALQAEAALATLLIRPNIDLWADDKRKLEAALEIVRRLAS